MLRRKSLITNLSKAAEIALLFALLSCGGATRSAPGGSAPQSDICNCTPGEPASADYRHDAKHVLLPPDTPQEITVTTVLGWERGPEPAFNAARQGRELQMFHIAQAWLQATHVNPGDCDMHVEISETPDKNAPRVIVETPIETEYCSARRNLQSALARRGVIVDNDTGVDLAQPVAVEVTGLAFQDFDHPRGSPQVATPWEIHPAIVTVLP